jgi:kinesin family member 1
VGKTTIIIDKETGAKKNYTFDYSFWSHDGFETTPEGLYVATNDHYADQKTVYNAVTSLLSDSLH